jgi:hypothetical protein
LDLVLSEQPPDLRQSRLRYVFTPVAGDHEADEQSRYRTRALPLNAPAERWTRYEIRPAGDAAGDLGGEDNALSGIRLGLRVRRGARLRLFVDDLTIGHRYAGDELHARQRATARRLAERYGVVCHVAQEISQAGPHKNAWGAGVPVLSYAAQTAPFTHDDGVAWARRHRAVFSLNHPFSKYARLELTDSDRERILAAVLEDYAAARVSGANTLEVGFPAGRHGFALEDYLRLWDGLSARGVIVTGSGSSDAHSARVGWQTGNNFATFVRSASTDEDALLAGLRSGNLYMADPVLFRSRLRFADRAGHRMGQVAQLTVADDAGSAGDGAASGAESAPEGGEGIRAAQVELALERAQPHWRLKWVVNGERQPGIPLAAGADTHTLPVPLGSLRDTKPDEPVFVRAEIWDTTRTPAGDIAAGAAGADSATGRCIALTNPIWYVREIPEGVTEERLNGEG